MRILSSEEASAGPDPVPAPPEPSPEADPEAAGWGPGAGGGIPAGGLDEFAGAELAVGSGRASGCEGLPALAGLELTPGEPALDGAAPAISAIGLRMIDDASRLMPDTLAKGSTPWTSAGRRNGVELRDVHSFLLSRSARSALMPNGNALMDVTRPWRSPAARERRSWVACSR